MRCCHWSVMERPAKSGFRATASQIRCLRVGGSVRQPSRRNGRERRLGPAGLATAPGEEKLAVGWP
jgi:hypothetical protein